MTGLPPRRWRAALDPAGSLLAIATQAAVFQLVPVLNRVYDGWPRGWLVLSVAVLAALLRGTAAGMAALVTGAALIWWRGTTFIPMHPGLEVFAGLGLLQIFIIHRLRQRTAALRLSESRFMRAFHGNAAGMAITRAADGLLMDVNEAYERLSGFSREELLGRRALTLWRRQGDRAVLVARLRDHGGITNYEVEAFRKDGTSWVALVSAQISTLDGQEVIVSSVIDISDRKRAEDALRQANRDKDQFLALLSHELRTPLNVILGYSRLLETPMATPSFVANAVAIIRRNAAMQLRLVEDLLDVQRILQHGFAVEPSEFELQPLVRGVMESLRLEAAAKGIHWSESVVPIRLEADRARIEQVLWNLLANAVKFTPERGCIGVSAFTENGDVVLQVEDSGPGIPEEFLPHLFEPFRQLDMSTTRRHGGLGLGLAIVKGVIEAHGGSVAAESAGAGTRITARMPLRRGTAPEGDADGRPAAL